MDPSVWIMGGIVVLGIAQTVIMVVRYRRSVRLAQRGGCVACGSTEVQVMGQQQRCQECGYVGAVDGGGPLGAAEFDALHPPPSGDDPH